MRGGRVTRARLLPVVGVVVVVVALIAVVASFAVRRQSAAGHAADRHAATAGFVMTRGLDPVPTQWAAWQVAGHVGDTTIEALAAEGTTWNGSVTLRITVTRYATGFGRDDDVATRCYSYRFAHDLADVTPHRLSKCPSRSALVLTAPPPALDLSAAGARRLAHILSDLPAASRGDGDATLRAVRVAFGPPAIVTGGVDSRRTLLVNVRFNDACLIASMPAGHPPQVASIHGPDCRGG